MWLAALSLSFSLVQHQSVGAWAGVLSGVWRHCVCWSFVSHVGSSGGRIGAEWQLSCAEADSSGVTRRGRRLACIVCWWPLLFSCLLTPTPLSSPSQLLDQPCLAQNRHVSHPSSAAAARLPLYYPAGVVRSALSPLLLFICLVLLWFSVRVLVDVKAVLW